MVFSRCVISRFYFSGIVNLINYFWCSVNKNLSVPHKKVKFVIDNRHFITYFSLDFQFQDLRKMNQHCESTNETIVVKITYTSLE